MFVRVKPEFMDVHEPPWLVVFATPLIPYPPRYITFSLPGSSAIASPLLNALRYCQRLPPSSERASDPSDRVTAAATRFGFFGCTCTSATRVAASGPADSGDTAQ